jgi:hypothetical protein
MEAIDMTTEATALTTDWDAAEWANTDRPAPARDVTKWSLWQWVGTPRPEGAPIDGRGDSGFSGFGHNPSGQHWAERNDAKS